MIVGTVGHVDHGKTALVRALTGVDTDRLKEEKARGITIDLGFAYMPGSDGVPIGFVDMPGHETLVRTMVAGAAGIDFALLVVAADEGIKPQTLEHLDVLDLLGLTRGMVVVTKSDRADETRRASVLAEIAARLATHPFAATLPLFVSSRTGENIDRLKAHLLQAQRDPRHGAVDRLFRLAIDRVFTLNGVGTVVAGIALAGRIRVDDVVTLMPSRQRARVRSLHVQNASASEGQAGDRCALALAGVAKDEVARGSWVCAGSDPAESLRFDAKLRLLPAERKPLGQFTPAHLHCGASDIPARVIVLSDDTLAPGETGFAQILLSAPLPLRHGDRFVLRDTSARRTIGGGTVVAPQAPARRRRTADRLQRLAGLEIDDPGTALGTLLDMPPFAEEIAAFEADRGLAPDAVATMVAALDLVVESDGLTSYALRRAQCDARDAEVLAFLADHHAAHPELPGLAAERLRQMMAPVPPKPLFAAQRARLLRVQRIAVRGHWLHLPSHVAQLGADDRRIADLMMPLVEVDRFKPPRVRDVAALIGFHETRVRQACKALARTGLLIEIATDHFFKRETVVEMADIARELTARAEDGRFVAAAFRDRLDNGRKVAIQILEFFDRQGLTHRSGDLRRVVKAPSLVFGDRLGGLDAADRV